MRSPEGLLWLALPRYPFRSLIGSQEYTTHLIRSGTQSFKTDEPRTMLHIFDQKEPDPQLDRKQAMDRLQNVLGGERRTATPDALARAAENRPAVGREPA